MTDEAKPTVEHVERSLRDVESREYERAVEAMVRLDGPAGLLAIRRAYEALPYHNDELGTDDPDSNDELLDRPDAVHVHTRYYRPENDSETYFLDRHETWRLDPAILGDEARFRTACERHHLADLAAEYRWATDGDARRERSRPDRAVPAGWERLG